MTDQQPILLLHLTIEPRTLADEEKLAGGLSALMAEDLTLRVRTSEETRQVVISGTSERQLETIVDRLAREFHVEARVGRLQVACRETLTHPADGEMKYARQTGGRGQYGHVRLHVYPGKHGTGYVFENTIANDSIPQRFIYAIDEGIAEALTRGVLTSYPVDDVRVVLYDGSYHDVDSSATAFRIAGAMAFQDAARKAKPVLLEPVMLVEIIVPTGYVRDVLDDMATRRGRIQSRDRHGNTETITARVPLPELLGYLTELDQRTHGRATCAMQFDRYEPRDRDDAEGLESPAGVPQRPTPPLRSAAISLPEPDAATDPEP
jgi:elongation factor G